MRVISMFVVTFSSLCAGFEALPREKVVFCSSELGAVGDTLSSGVCCLVVSLI